MTLRARLAERLRDERGVTFVEYAIIVGGVGLASLAGFFTLNNALAGSYATTSDTDPGTCTTADCNTLTNGDVPPAPFTNTVDFGAPGAPQSFAGEGRNASAVLTWSSPLTTGGSPIVSYTVTSVPGSAGCTTGSTPGCTITGLTNGTTYTFSITATNADGFTSPPASTTATPTRAQSISFTAPATGYVGGTATLTASATSGLAVTFGSSTSATCTVSGSVVTYAGAGTCTLTADQAGDANWDPAPQVTGNVLVGKGTQTISFTAPATGVAGGSATLSATATSGLPVDFTSATPSVCSVSGNTVSYLTGGTCTINANQAGDTNWNPALQATGSVTVSKKTQTITFAAATSGAVGGTASLSATATSGLPVTFSSGSTSICTVSGSTVTYIAVGTCTIRADQAGDATWSAAAQVSDTTTVGKGSQLISFTAPATVGAVGGTDTLSATATSGLTVTFTSATTSKCTVSGTTVSYVATGTCTINANQSGNANWNAAPQVSVSITVKRAQTISFSAPRTGSVGGSATLSATASPSSLTVTFSSSTPSVCTVSGTTVTYVGVGTCSIDADQAGNATYAPAPTVTDTITISKGNQTITFSAPATGVVGGTATLTATATSGLPVTFTSGSTSVCTVSGSTVSYLTAGTCTLRADQAGDADWNAATRVTDTTTVNKKSQTITFAAPTSGTVDGTATLSASSTSGLTVTFSSGSTSICTVSGTTVTYVGGGTCTINADQAGDSTWAAATQVSDTTAVSKKSQTITFSAPASAKVGAPATLTASATSGLTVTFSSGTTSVCTVSGSTVTYLTVGTCTLRADQAGDTAWAAATRVSGNVTVSKGDQTISFTPPATGRNGRTGTLSATAGSSLTVVFTSATPTKCTVSGTTVSYIATGTCTINANQSGNANWNAAPQVSGNITVN